MTQKRRILAPLALLALVLASLACSLVGGTAATTAPPVNNPPTAIAPTTPPTEAAVIAINSQVRRLAPGVFAGKANPLPELTSDDLINLEAGGLVTTNTNGEAEVDIQGCLKLFIFQDTSLQRDTCRKADAASGLGVCGTAGMTGVVNNCTSQVNIQTPSSSVNTNGTWFGVIYLQPDKLTIVQVYEGAVGVRAIIDPATGQLTNESELPAGSLWFSSPGASAPTINGIAGRQAQPMEVWQALRPALIGKYPILDRWMKTAQNRAQGLSLAFPEELVPTTGQVNLHFVGASWNNTDAQNALLQGVPWKDITNSLWPGVPVTYQIQFPDRTIADATTQTYDLAAAQALLKNSQFYAVGAAANEVTFVFNTNDAAAPNFIDQFLPHLERIGFKYQIVSWNDAEFTRNLDAYRSGNRAPLIWLDESGKLFSK